MIELRLIYLVGNCSEYLVGLGFDLKFYRNWCERVSSCCSLLRVLVITGGWIISIGLFGLRADKVPPFLSMLAGGAVSEDTLGLSTSVSVGG